MRKLLLAALAITSLTGIAYAQVRTLPDVSPERIRQYLDTQRRSADEFAKLTPRGLKVRMSTSSNNAPGAPTNSMREYQYGPATSSPRRSLLPFVPKSSRGPPNASMELSKSHDDVAVAYAMLIVAPKYDAPFG